MNDEILHLHGIPCATCGQPAKSHDFTTGQTFHVAVKSRPCQTQLPRR